MAVTVSASSFSHFWASTREWPTVEQRRGRERQYWPGGQKQRYGASPGSQCTKTGHLGEAAGTAQSSPQQRHLGWGRDWRGPGGSMRGTGRGRLDWSPLLAVVSNLGLLSGEAGGGTGQIHLHDSLCDLGHPTTPRGPGNSLWISMTFSMDRTALALGLCCKTFSGRGSS